MPRELSGVAKLHVNMQPQNSHKKLPQNRSFEAVNKSLEIRLFDLKVPPYLPGVSKHLPDVFELDPSE